MHWVIILQGFQMESPVIIITSNGKPSNNQLLSARQNFLETWVKL